MKKKMELKTLIGNNAYWTINKSLAKDIGLEATLVLQHLIDLDENYFDGQFWQTGTSIQESTFLSKHKVSKAITTLSNVNYIEVENKVPTNSRTIAKVYHFTILKSNIILFFDRCQSNSLTDISKEIEPTPVKKFDRVDKEKVNKEKLDKKNTNKLDILSDDDIKGKIFFKIVEHYPKNRIGNRQHGLKKFKLLTMDNAKLSIKNLKRYLSLSEGFHKSLQNYIIEECYSEEWLKAEEAKNNKQDKPNTKTLNENYDNIT